MNDISQKMWETYWSSRELYGNDSKLYHNKDAIYASYQNALQYLDRQKPDLYTKIMNFAKEDGLTLFELIKELSIYSDSISEDEALYIQIIITILKCYKT